MNSSQYTAAWMVRAGQGGFLLDEFKDQSIISIGWDIEKIENTTTNEEIKNNLFKIYPDWSIGQINNAAGQIWRFVNEFKIGNGILTYDPSLRLYWIGKITSEYFYNEKYQYPHFRKVEWNSEPISRDSLTTGTKNTLGSTLTIFKIPEESWNELNSLLTDIPNISEEEIKSMEEAGLEFLKEDIINKSQEFIKDKITKLQWDEMEELVAGLVRSMGYKTRMTKKGADLGKDIMASPDGLGLEEPRIKIEVKHRKEKIGADLLRSFLGGLRGYDKALYVSTSGFTKEAIYEADRANNPLTLIDLDLLAELIINNYQNFDSETKALIPLRKIYWPI